MVENEHRTVIRVVEWFLWMRDVQEKSKIKSPTRKPDVWATQIRFRICCSGHPSGHPNSPYDLSSGPPALGNFRHLVVRYDRSLTIYGAFFHIACFMIVLRRVLK